MASFEWVVGNRYPYEPFSDGTNHFLVVLDSFRRYEPFFGGPDDGFVRPHHFLMVRTIFWRSALFSGRFYDGENVFNWLLGLFSITQRIAASIVFFIYRQVKGP